MPRKPRVPRKENGEEYRFRVDAYSPAEIPMLRLAEYMQQLAQILGETTQVHFRRVARGSTVLVHQIEQEAVPKVRHRLSQVRSGEGPTEAQRAYRAANRLLREDNAVGDLRNGHAKNTGGSSVILRFPGRDEDKEEFAIVRQQGSFDGIVTGVSGKDTTAHILLLVEGQQISGFYTTRAIAKQIGAKFDDAVRLFGRGRWRRDNEGIWVLIDFKVESWAPLDDASLSDALADLRSIPTEWNDNAYAELDEIRHGPPDRTNGGH